MNRPSAPSDPVSAVSHPDPYPYYADLVAHRPLYRDEGLGLWVASSAAAVTAVLSSALCRVRPPAEPVPTALTGSPMAEIFRHLVRQNDGRGHQPFKQVVATTLGSIDPAQAAARGRTWAKSLAASPLGEFAFHLPVYVTASLLGVPKDELPPMALQVTDLVSSFAPGGGADALSRGKAAADSLLAFFRARASDPEPAGLVGVLAREARRVGRDESEVIAANAIGLMVQAHDATAALIGNALMALASHPEAREQVQADRALFQPFFQEVLRHDPPVQNTRRFLAKDGVIAGQEMQTGDAILVVLAAANRDPVANPNPDRFDLFRENRMIFTFGAGVHACPGEALALTIAQAGIEQLLGTGIDLERFRSTVKYRRSVNARIPFAG